MSYIINPGRLNKRVSVYGNKMVENELLELEQKEVLICKVWAMITMKKARNDNETEIDVERAINRIYVTIRYREDIEKDNIIVINGLRYEVKTIIDIGFDKQFLEIMCERTTE